MQGNALGKLTYEARPQLLKVLNQSAVLELIRSSSPISRADVARATGLSRPTVSQAVKNLMALDLVREVGAGDAAVGRKPVLLTFNANAAYVIGVDLGATKTLLGVTNLEGKILSERRYATPVEAGLEAVVSSLFVAVEDLLMQAGLSFSQVCGIGVGVSGAVDADGTVIDGSGLGASQWPLRRILEERFRVPIVVDNDVNTHLRGEQWKGAAIGRRDALCVSLGTGVGAALLIDGHIHRGSHHVAGEVGTTLADRGLLRTNHHGGYGPLEREMSGPGLVRHAIQQMNSGRDSLLREAWQRGEPITPREIFQAARQQDPLALETVQRLADDLALLLGNTCLVVDPELIVLTGSLTAGADVFLPTVLEYMNNFVLTMPEVVVSSLGAKAGVLGAVAGVLSLGQSSISFHANESVIMMGTRET